MRRRSRILVIVAGLALCPVLGSWSLALHALRMGRVNDVNFFRVRPGLPEDGVERLFGGPGMAVPECDPVDGLKAFRYVTWDGRNATVYLDGCEYIKRWKEGGRDYVVMFTSGGEVLKAWDDNPRPLNWVRRVYYGVGRRLAPWLA